MRVYIHIPDKLIPMLQDQAHAAHRPPRYQLEWLIRQVLQEDSADGRPSQSAPNATAPEVASASAT